MIQQRLNSFLEAQNMSGYRLAQITGLSQGAISLYRNGKRTPRNAELRKIAKALDVRVSELFDE